MYAVGMMGTKKLGPAIEAGVESVKKADASLRLVIGLAATGLLLSFVTLALVAVLAVKVSARA